ncbi:CobW family GTP-binding protein [Roseomonas marmotae]|uniref:GTP-binding protein n=1 Tax=Roseomonas marmotae TaxID=2768161 RepID=A0ABS3KD81_9PROT|nr:CobW family GTP-binding protein [Roseomonas marmotae]MBO1074598.1 GTP-binding protein [Roseomonas marmotae]QTI81625.1 GTP-binding protein [Roseomonas marmotae]
MAIPVLLVSGFLGAGKTTLINHLLTQPHGRRLAAVVNDFGAINIDAELLSARADGVVALQNGCICCSLQGDLLRTLGLLLRQDPVPEGIIIETSGVSDPAEIVRSLMDPVIWREAALDAVLCLADARALADRPALLQDPLCQSQLRAADIIVLNKVDEVSAEELAALRPRLDAARPGCTILEAVQGAVPPELFFTGDPWRGSIPAAPSRFSTPRFETMSWTSDAPLSLPRFQAAVSRLAPRLVRAKGILQFAGREGQPMLFQMVGQRATFSPAPPPSPDAAPVRLVLIAENGRLRPEATTALLESCRA